MKFFFSRYSVAAFIFVLPSSQAFAFGGGQPTPALTEATTRTGMATNLFVEASGDSFSATPPDGLAITPSCLRKGGVELLILDPGHDDSAMSMRSDAKVRGGGSSTKFIWPKIHEGNLTQVTAWLVYDLMMKDERLSARERQELQTMVRFTRHPGEKTYGQYEKELGYSSSTQGTIDSGVTNRASRIRFMMENHRAYDPNNAKFWAGSSRDVTSKSVMISIHANSSDYFNEGDVSWVIPPKSTSGSSATGKFQLGMVKGLSQGFGEYYGDTAGDPRAVSDLKSDLASTVRTDSIQTKQHSVNLAVLSPTLGSSSTRKLLIEGFVMNGKAGNLANRQLTQPSGVPKLSFKHAGKAANSYGVTDVYVAYARGIVRGINTALDCTK